eukprot:COSAG01_NODE_9548_length_2413_cov_4.644339_1_plen_120_part_00
MLRRSAPNLRAVTSQMVQDLGLVTGLYRGAAPPMLSSGVVSMMIWSSFETLKRRIHSHSPADTPVSLVTIWIAAACAPMTVLPITVPQQRCVRQDADRGGRWGWGLVDINGSSSSVGWC